MNRATASAPTLPAEILRMDKQSIRLYKKALSEGETPVHSIRVMVVGHYGVGKTTLTKRLLGEDVYLGARDSTDGIDVHVRRCRVSLADQKWTVLKKDENVDNVSRRLVQVLAKQSISDTAATITVETASTSADAESLHKVTVPKTVDDENANTAEVVPTNDTIPKTPVEADVTKQCVEGDTENDAIIKDLKDLISNISISKYKDNDHADVSILDFGGQSVFYNTHQMFLSPRAIYILVMDISKHIDDIVDDDICYFDIKGGVLYKIKEFFKLWLNSIHACCPPDKVGVPRIILVATHAGKLDQERRKELEDKYFEAVRNTFDGSVAYMHVVDADFSIDNEIVDPNIAALQNKIYEVASQQDHWGERIPANWLTVERALGELRNKGLKIITRDRLQDVNNSMHVPIATEDSLNVFLRFQHDTTNILYFNEAGLRDIVVLDPQWLVDSLKSVITSKDFVIKKPAIYELWKELYATGILRQKLIEAVWKREETFWDHKDHLLQLMKKLNIIAQIHGQTPDDCYIVPCMLKEAPDDRIKVDPNSTSVMCITTEDGFLTAGIFQRLLAGCVSKWPISKQHKKDLIYCGCGCFEIDTFHRMTLYFHACTIQMWVTCHGEENPLDPDLCAKVREYILQTLQNINTCLGLSQYSNLKLSIKCPKQGLDELEDGMFQIEQLEKHNEIPCHAHNETHILQCSDMLRCWYGGNIRPDSQDHYRSVRSPHIRETIPNDKQLSNIASKIGKEYEQLGLELGLTQVKIDQIKLENPRNVVGQTTKILLAWKESVGWQATFRVLDQAMRTVDIDTTTALAGIN